MIGLGIPEEISAVVWVNVRWVVIVDTGNGPESGSESIVRIPCWNWFLIQMSVVVRNKGNFLQLLLPDNRRIPH